VLADATGRFPEPSRQSSEYMIVFAYNTRSTSMWNVRETVPQILMYKRLLPPLIVFVPEVIDNETSADLKQLFSNQHIEIQTVPPGDKRANKADGCIQTWRNHFISKMGTINSRCPSNLCEDFVHQMELTLARLRPFADDRTVSSWEGIHGHKHDFLAHPISVCGTAVYVFESTDVRATWDCHGRLGFYVGPALDSYHTYRCHVTATNRIRITNTVQFFPEDIHLPATRLDDAIARTVSELSSQNKNRVLDNEPSRASPPTTTLTHTEFTVSLSWLPI